MSRPRVVVTNLDKKGEPFDGWHVCVGGFRKEGKWQGGRRRTFNTAEEWAKDGLSWVMDALKQAVKK